MVLGGGISLVSPASFLVTENFCLLKVCAMLSSQESSSGSSDFLYLGVREGFEDGPGEVVDSVKAKVGDLSSPEAADEDDGLALMS